MLQLNSHSVNFNGESVVEFNNAPEVAATMSVSYSGDNIYISFNIINLDAYLANKTVVDGDFIAFKDKAIETIKVM